MVGTAHAHATKTFTTAHQRAESKVATASVGALQVWTASADCTICGTYHIVEANGNAVVFLEAFTSQGGESVHFASRSDARNTDNNSAACAPAVNHRPCRIAAVHHRI